MAGPSASSAGRPGVLDVARRAGVSTATVSRVLNNADGVRAEYREKVLEAARELGYRPNRVARNLRRRTAEMIGVVVSDIENPHFTETVRALEDAAYRAGHRVLLCNTDEEPAKQAAYLEMLLGERVSGVLISPSDPEGAEIGMLLDQGIPVIAFDRGVADARADAVVADGEAATWTATRHLLALGHERIGLVAGPPHLPTGASRLAGYERAMAQAGAPSVWRDGGFREAAGRAALHALLEAEPGLTAVVAANNLSAGGVLQGLRAAGRRVPDDVALVALDDPMWAPLVQPPLTVLAQPVRRMADAAMRLLLERIADGRDAAVTQTFEFELRVRESCGTPVARGKDG